jgi:hypothetical protein
MAFGNAFDARSEASPFREAYDHVGRIEHLLVECGIHRWHIAKSDCNMQRHARFVERTECSHVPMSLVATARRDAFG